MFSRLLLRIATLVHLKIAIVDVLSITAFLPVLRSQDPHLKSLTLSWQFPLITMVQIISSFPNLDSFTSSQADPVLLKYLPADLKNWTILPPIFNLDKFTAQLSQIQALVQSNVLKGTRSKLQKLFLPTSAEIEELTRWIHFLPRFQEERDKLEHLRFSRVVKSYHVVLQKLSEQASQRGILIERIRYP